MYLYESTNTIDQPLFFLSSHCFSLGWYQIVVALLAVVSAQILRMFSVCTVCVRGASDINQKILNKFSRSFWLFNALVFAHIFSMALVSLSFYSGELCVLFSLNYNHCILHLQYSIGIVLFRSYATWMYWLDAEQFFLWVCIVCVRVHWNVCSYFQ